MTFIITGAAGHYGRLVVGALLARGVLRTRSLPPPEMLGRPVTLPTAASAVRPIDYDDVESLRKPFAGRTRSCWSPERSPESASRSTGMRSIRQLRPVALRWAAKARQSRG
jgi:hypothetical protein